MSNGGFVKFIPTLVLLYLACVLGSLVPGIAVASNRSETADRSVVRTSGIVRSDAASKLYAAPPFEDVAVKVVEALVGSLPPR